MGFAVRIGTGISPVHGSVGDYNWRTAGSTFFWIDPQSQWIGIFMVQAPSVRIYYRQLIKSLVL